MLKFQFACMDLFPSLQIRKTTQTSDWCFVCVQDLFVKIDFSGSKMIHHRKFHSVRKFFVMHQRWCPLQTAFLHLRESTKILETVCSFIISKLRFWFCWNLTETPQKMKTTEVTGRRQTKTVRLLLQQDIKRIHLHHQRSPKDVQDCRIFHYKRIFQSFQESIAEFNLSEFVKVAR